VEQQVNLPKWSRWWIQELVSWDRGQYSKLKCPTLLEEEPTRVAAVGQFSCHLAKTTTALTTLNELAVSYLSSQLQYFLWTEGNKYYSQVSHLNF
jgi:hypothetical protein